MKKFFLPLLTFLLLFLFPPVVFAHPGRTAADGCHYCRTNCDYWGVPWNVRHCHGGTAPVVPEYSAPKTESTSTPTRKPTPTPTLSLTPTPEPEVKGETTQLPSPPIAVVDTQTKETGTGDTLLGLGILAVLGGGAFWLMRSLWRKFKGRTSQQNE